MEKANNKWSNKDTKSLTEDFINHIYSKYYKSYNEGSNLYQKINNSLYIIITIIGFSVTLLIGLKEIIPEKIDETLINVVIFILPSISSVLLVIINQKGFRQLETLREDARIKCKYLVNEAKIKFSTAQSDSDYELIYKWLNEEVRILQLNQANEYYSAQNKLVDSERFSIKNSTTKVQ